ncbi:MAG: substrate-binding domain-containing protein [Syntrophobacteraceae bacterium]|nr:substrate-binding domain-containing protein [Syntrophobacteraceae bacterium]
MKNLLKSTLVGFSVLALAGTASAQININLYGASAQHLFWNDAADDFLINKGCTNVGRAQFDTKNGITRGTCGGQQVYIRYSSKASFDGILALKGDDSMAGSAEKCVSTSLGFPGSGLAPYYRMMVDESSCTAWTGGTSCSRLKCQRITLGASDVAGESFVQSSSGQLKGPLGGGAVSRSFSGIDTTGLEAYNPLVVPFGFFVNKSVKKDGLELDNISRMQAVQIFSGQAFFWTDFGTNFSVTGNPSANIVGCYRHAGSGTHATMDFAVMKGNGWGASLPQNQVVGGPTVYFNDGSSDMMNCINGSGTWNGLGAIGYADADQALALPANTKALKYNGEAGSRVNVRNGLYDFWSVQWLYEDPAAPGYSNTHPLVTELMAYASVPANVPSTKAAYWAAKDEMNFLKGTDQEYPAFTGCQDCQNP